MRFRGVLCGAVSLASLVAAGATSAAGAGGVELRQDSGNTPAARANPQKVTFTVPLVFNGAVYGDVLVEVDGSGRYLANTEDLRREFSVILGEEGLAALDQVIAGKATVSQNELISAGFDLEFDSGRIELVLRNMPARYRQVQRFGRDSSRGSSAELVTIEPEHISSFMNVTANFDYDSELGRGDPDLFLDGATRIGKVVIEYDGAFTRQFSENFRFLRRSTRAVYDDVANYRRFSAGDVRPRSLSIIRSPELGGVAVDRNRQLYEPFVVTTRLSGRQIVLDNRSTVDVLVSGQLYESVQLDAGVYDLSDLPVRQGTNDIQLVIRDSFGRREVVNLDFFSEALDLPAGESEYSFAIGMVSDTLFFEPEYRNELAATGFYRRAFSSDLVVGAAAQVSENVQLVGASVSSVPQTIPGVFDLELAGSQFEGDIGIAISAGYRLLMGDTALDASQFIVNVDYESAAFTTLADPFASSFDLLSIAATYSRNLGADAYGLVGINYLSSSAQPNDNYNIYAEYNRRLSRRLRFRIGAEYGSNNGQEDIGIRAGIAMDIGRRARLNADYRSRVDNFRAALTRSASEGVGQFGYGVAFSRFSDSVRGDLNVDYAANRFDARATVTTGGDGFGEFFSEQNARLQLATSLAFAGNSFGIGRPIYDSFLLARPHSRTDRSDVITGRSLSGGAYDARSGIFGAAVQRNLSSYNEQSVQYDFANPDIGYDIGDGLARVSPPYKSGYSLTVGDDHFVSILGSLADENGPLALATGQIYALDPEEEFEPLAVFTNSVGRFAVSGLAPGQDYEIRLSNSDKRVRISIPEDSIAMVRLGTLSVHAAQ